MLLDTFYTWREETSWRRWRACGKTACLYVLLCVLSYLFYWPFYASYQQLYVNGLGFVNQSTGTGAYLHVFGIWLFLCASFLLFELYRWWRQFAEARPASFSAYLWRWPAWERVGLYAAQRWFPDQSGFAGHARPANSTALARFVALFLARNTFQSIAQRKKLACRTRYNYFSFILLGLIIATLGIQVIYIRDFLDNSGYVNEHLFQSFPCKSGFVWVLVVRWRSSICGTVCAASSSGPGRACSCCFCLGVPFL